jgi:hypothetical protein
MGLLGHGASSSSGAGQTLGGPHREAHISSTLVWNVIRARMQSPPSPMEWTSNPSLESL